MFLIRNSKRFDSLTSRSPSLRLSRLRRGFPAAPFSTARGMKVIAEFWVAHASRVLASASSRSRTSFNVATALRMSLRQSSFRRDAETSTRDACATP
jgi:hypothetical protein